MFADISHERQQSLLRQRNFFALTSGKSTSPPVAHTPRYTILVDGNRLGGALRVATS